MWSSILEERYPLAVTANSYDPLSLANKWITSCYPYPNVNIKFWILNTIWTQTWNAGSHLAALFFLKIKRIVTKHMKRRGLGTNNGMMPSLIMSSLVGLPPCPCSTWFPSGRLVSLAVMRCLKGTRRQRRNAPSSIWSAYHCAPAPPDFPPGACRLRCLRGGISCSRARRYTDRYTGGAEKKRSVKERIWSIDSTMEKLSWVKKIKLSIPSSQL